MNLYRYISWRKKNNWIELDFYEFIFILFILMRNDEFEKASPHRAF